MILPLKECSLGWMDVLLNSVTGLRINQTISEKKTVYTPLDRAMDTCGMTWIVQLAINTLAKKVSEQLATKQIKILAANFIDGTRQI